MQFQFREAHDSDELEPLFRFRYETLRSSKLRGFVPETRSGLHLEFFDHRSYHLGLYLEDGETEKIVGYERVIIDGPGPSHDAVWEIADRYEELRGALTEDPGVPFPSLAYAHSDNVGPLRDFCRGLMQRGRLVAETSRTCIHPQFRSIRVARFFVDSIIAGFYLGAGFDDGIMHVGIHHCPFYERLGFVQIPGTRTRFCASTNEQAACLHLGREGIADRALPRLQVLASRFRTVGRTSISLDRAAA